MATTRVVVAACIVAVAYAAPVPQRVADAFSADGFVATTAVAHGAGLCVAARSINATINGGAAKPAYYCEGPAYDVGFALGVIAEPAVSLMTGPFLNHIVPSLISPEVDDWLQNSTFAPVYDALIDALATLLVENSVEYFTASVAAGAIPVELVDEMRGLSDGARSANVSSPAAFVNLVAINTGYDMLLALIFRGEILNLLGDTATRRSSPELGAAIRALPASAIRLPVFCNAFAARGSLTRNSSPLFARDFMFSLGEVFQDVVSTTIYVPSEAGRLPLVSVAAPGFVGSMVAMNAPGFAMGVDVLQAALGNTDNIGINSLLMVRATAHASRTTAAATDYVIAAQRGVPWLYPMSDATGDGRVLECAPSCCDDPSPLGCAAGLPDWRPLVEDALLRALLPSPAEISSLLDGPVDFKCGVFTRRVGAHTMPEARLGAKYNPALFARAGLPMPPPAAWGAPGAGLWANFTAEEDAYSRLAQAFFSPERIPTSNSDLIAVSNLALSPHLRIAGMTFWTSLDGMGAPQWRYDSLLSAFEAELQAAGGQGVDALGAQRALEFLSRVPGYEKEATIGGVLAVADLSSRVLSAKGGYWVDAWTRVSLCAYLADPVAGGCAPPATV